MSALRIRLPPFMSSSTLSPRTAVHKPGLVRLAAVATACVPVLPMLLGARTTSIGAGMIFKTWPFSNGSLNPPGWLDDPAQFAEHAHRLSAGLVGLMTVTLAVLVWRTEARAWLRQLAIFAAGLVLVQAVVGGLRVLLDDRHLNLLTPSVGRLFAMLHACLAQIFFCALLAIALSLSRAWNERAVVSVGRRLRQLGVVCCVLLLVQLVVAAVMRHLFAGLAIPTFPAATPDGGLLPAGWDFNVGLNFFHTRVLAGLLSVALPWLAAAVWRDRAAGVGMKRTAVALVALLITQITLGAEIIWRLREPDLTTAHVVVGACTLATTFGITWWAHRETIEKNTMPAPAALAAPARGEGGAVLPA